jgi:hypothetical protein
MLHPGMHDTFELQAYNIIWFLLVFCRNTAAHHSVQQGNVGDGDLWWLCDAYMLMHKHINDPSTVEMLTYILVQCSFICVLLINVASMLFFP